MSMEQTNDSIMAFRIERRCQRDLDTESAGQPAKQCWNSEFIQIEYHGLLGGE